MTKHIKHNKKTATKKQQNKQNNKNTIPNKKTITTT